MRGTLEKVEIRESVVIENDGQQIFGMLHRPIGFDNSPIVVILHGFASSKHGSNRCYVTLAEALTKQGVAAFRFDFRGSGDSEGTLSDISFEDLVSDAVAVLETVETFEGIDASRIALFGASLGGAIGVLAAARFQKVKAIALWAAVASGELWYRDFLIRYPEHMHADPSKVLSSYRGVKLNEAFRTEFRQMFAYQAVHELKNIPLLLMQGEKDDTVSIAHLEAFRQACAASHLKTRCIKYPDAEHSLGFSPYFPQVIEDTLSWFHQNL